MSNPWSDSRTHPRTARASLQAIKGALRQHALALSIAAGLTLLALVAALILLGPGGGGEDQLLATATHIPNSALAMSASTTPTPDDTPTPTATVSATLSYSHTPTPSSTPTATPSPTPYSLDLIVSVEQSTAYATPRENCEMLGIVRRNDREQFDVTAHSTRALVSAIPLPPTDIFSPPPPALPSPTKPLPSSTPTNSPPSPTPTATSFPFSEGPVVFGHSAGGRDLVFYRLGTGPSDRAIIGGIHGGYEWNTTVLVSQTLEYLQAHPETVPVSVTLYIIPLLNPDGFIAGRDAIHGRMNANGVDLNRNWDYQWQMTATHGLRPVSGGAYPFSEPETAALRDLILDRGVEAALVYHSRFSKIFSAADTTRSATIELAEMMSEVTGYPHAPEGVPGQITTGDAIDWMSTQGITAIEVELTNHDDPEWERNIKGIVAFLNWKLE